MGKVETVSVEGFEVPWDRYNQIAWALYDVWNIGDETALADILGICQGARPSQLCGPVAEQIWKECNAHRLLKRDDENRIAPNDEQTAAVLRDSIRREEGRLVFSRRYPANLYP